METIVRAGRTETCGPSRIIPLPVPVDANRGIALLADGFLEIVLSLAETWTPRAAGSEIRSDQLKPI